MRHGENKRIEIYRNKHKIHMRHKEKTLHLYLSQGEKEREWDSNSILRDNGQDFPKTYKRCQATDLRSSRKTKQD